MAQYKLIQDIEAEDKILGPLTLRQFIFGLAAAFLFYICFILITKHVVFLLVVFLPPALFCAFFAFPWGGDQPTETWALAKLRFWFKPRRRIWDQSGVKELVTITVPKKVERVLTKGFSQTEVKSRLRALADTLDSRGWAIKHISADAYAQPVANVGTDRLIDIDNLPLEVPTDDLTSNDDILDEANNPVARQFGTMIDRSTRDYRQQLLDEMNDIRQSQVAGQTSKWFMGEGGYSDVAAATPAVAGPAPEPTDMPDEAGLSASLATRASRRHESLGNLRTMRPLTGPPAAAGPAMPPAAAAATPADAVTATGDPAILTLAKNDDLNVATLARQARKNKGDEGQPRQEVVIPLH